jgi:GAF domain-containing protein
MPACVMDDAVRAHLGWITCLAQRTLRAEGCVLSVIDDQRQHFLAGRGLPFRGQHTDGTPLSHSLCRFVVERAAPLVVHDTAEHWAFAGHPAATELGVVAYAGTPVRHPDGRVFGSLCVFGGTPRRWSAEDLADLERFAVVVGDGLELAVRRAVA